MLRDETKSKRARLDFVRKTWDTDRLTRPIDLHRRWSYATDVRLQNDHLMWKQAESKRIGNTGCLMAGLLDVPLQPGIRRSRAGAGYSTNLCFSTAAEMRRYSNTTGLGGLELCRHNLPACHEFSLGVPLRLPIPIFVRSESLQGWRSDDPRQCPPTGREPLATWRFFSAQARALLNIAGDLQRKRLGDKDDWGKLLHAGVGAAQSLAAQKLCMRDAIEGWLKIGRIRPTVDDLTIGLTWTGADLFGELAVQIALAAKAMDGQVLCVACGKAYQPKRRVIRRGFNYCGAEKCQREAAAQRAKRYRDRKGSSEMEGIAKKLPFRGPYQGRTNDPLFSQ